MATKIDSPFPTLDAQTLRDLWASFQAEPALIDVHLDGRAYGAIAPDGTAVDELIVSQRDLRLIHDLDATRFGRYEDCPLCAADRESW